MVYPWSNKAKEEDTVKEEVTEKEEVIIEDTEKEEETIVWDNDDPRAILLNILKLEGYKMDSGELFNAYREASKESDNSIIMESFKKGLDQLSELGKIRSDSNGNIMTIQDFNREKSQQTDDEEDSEKETEVKEENEKDTDNNLEENNERSNDDLESIIQLKEETDSWLIEKLKNNKSNNNEADLREEVKELKDRIEKLESVIKNITKAFE